MRKLLLGFAIFTGTLLTFSKAHAAFGAGATYYIDFSAGGGGDGSYATPYNTISAAATAQGGGNVFIVKNGTYSSTTISTAPAGSATQQTVLKAETEGKVFFTASGCLNLPQNMRNLDFYGFNFNTTSEKLISGERIRFWRCGFVKGQSSGNVSNTLVGDGSNVARKVTFIECYWWGSGGRYLTLVYNSNMIIFQRCTWRHDNGWDDGGNEDPSAALTVYGSSDVWDQNGLVINSTNVPDTWAAANYLVDNGTTDKVTTKILFDGSIVLGVAGIAFRGDANLQCSSCSYNNVVAADARDGGITWGSGSGNVTASVNGFTVIMASLTNTGGFGSAFGDFGAGTKNIKNGIVMNWLNSDFDSVSATYFDTFGNGSASGGTGVQTYNPRLNGLKYLTRVETGSNLYTAGQNGVPMGAVIEKKFGQDGAFWGDSGYNTYTSSSVWPWPNEARIKGDYCSTRSDGLCDPALFNVSITSYVVGYTARFTNPYADDGGDSGGGGGSGPAPDSYKSLRQGGRTITGGTKL